MDGISFENLSAEFDTPSYFYSKNSIRVMFDNVKRIFENFDIIYSFKANPSAAICSELRKLGSGADVASENELKLALFLGFDPGKIIYTSPAKSEENIKYAIMSDILAINIESFEELEIVNRLAGEIGKKQKVILRINPGDVGLDLKEVMAGEGSKFGINIKSVMENYDKFERAENVSVAGIHVYTASQILDEDVIAANFKRTLECAKQLKEKYGMAIDIIDFGAGLGIPNTQSENSINTETLSAKIEKLRNDYRVFFVDTKFIVELGRYLVAASGIFVSKVMYRKNKNLIIDGGMNNFFRPLFMGFNHPTFVLNKIEERSVATYDIGGPICSPIDIIGKNQSLPEVEIGDFIGFFNAGAYGWSMSLQNFLSFPTAREVLVDENGGKIIREKSDWKDDLCHQKWE